MAYSRSKFGDITSQKSFQVGVYSVTTTAATFASGHLNSGVRLNPDGTDEIFVGTGGEGVLGITNGYALDGEVFIDIDELNKVFLKANAAGSTITYIAS